MGTGENMKACTFFGHRICPVDSIKDDVTKAIVQLIEEEQVDTFYVGNQGGYDALVLRVLRALAQQYPFIQYNVVLAYIPTSNEIDSWYPGETLIPDGIESVYKKFAISHRNQWMLKQSQYVVAYVTSTYGGAYQFVEKALRARKNVINIATSKKRS